MYEKDTGGSVMKKIVCFMLSALLVFLCGCSSGTKVLTNDKYSIREKDGAYFLKLHEPAGYYVSGHMQNASAPYVIAFSSVKEIKSAIDSGDFSDRQLQHIQSYFTEGNRNVEICNINELYDATVPQGVLVKEIHWLGDRYNFLLGDEGILYYTDKEYYDLFASTCRLGDGATDIADRNAKEAFFESFTGDEIRAVVYTHTTENKTITVYEEYIVAESNSIPYRIQFYGICDGAYFVGFLYEFTERPSYEWVTSFGLKPYVETETE
jgi:hypothetical protein